MLAGRLEIELAANVARLSQDMREAKNVVVGFGRDVEKTLDQVKSLFVGFGAGLSTGFFAAIVKSSIDALDHLGDLSRTTRVTASDLAGLSYAAKQNGSDLQAAAAAIDRLGTNIGKNGDKFRALGITARDPIEALKQLADISNNVGDTQVRNALLNETLGRSWERMAPLLAEGSARIGELVTEGARLSGVTEGLTRHADEFNDKLVKIIGNGGAMNAVLGATLPLLNGMADLLVMMRDRGDGVGTSLSFLTEVLRALVVLGGNVIFVLKAVGLEIGGISAQMAALLQGDFGRFAEISRQMKADAEANRRAFDAWERSIMALGTTAKATTVHLDAMDQVQRRMQQESSAAAREFLEAEERKKRAAKEAADAARASLRAQKEEWDNAFADLKGELQDLKTAYEGMHKMEEQFGKNILKITEDLNRAIVDELGEAVKEGMEVNQAWMQSWENMAEAAGNFFGDLIVNGRDAFDSLRRFVKQLLADMIALFAKRWILNMVAGGSMMGAAGAALGADGGGSLAGAGLNALSSLGGQSLMGAAGTYLFGSAVGPAAPGLLGAGGFSATVGSWAGTAATALGATATTAATLSTTIAAAIPVIGWVVAIGGLLYAAFGRRGGGPKAGGSFFGDFGGGGALMGDLTGSLDRSRHLHDETQMDSTAQQISTELATTIARTIAQLGGSSQGFQLGVGFNRDPAGTAPSMASMLLRDASGRTLLEQVNRDVSRADGALEQEMSLQGQRAVLAALQASNLPREIAAIINSAAAESASAEQIQAILAAAVDMKTVLDNIGNVPGLDLQSLQGMQQAGETLAQTLARVSEAFHAAVQNMYATAASMSSSFGSSYASANLDAAAARWAAIGSPGWTAAQVIDEIGGLINGGTAANPGGFSDALRYVQGMGPDAVAAFNDLLNAYRSYQGSVVSAGAAIPPLTSSIGALGTTASNAADELERARQSVRDYLDSLFLDDQLSPLSPTDRLNEARGQFDDILARARAGDPTAMGQLSGASDAYLRIAREMFASGSGYLGIFNEVTGQLASVSGYTGTAGGWSMAFEQALPRSSTLASQDDIRDLARQIIAAIGGAAAANDEAVGQQTEKLRAVRAEPARR